ncbi:alpha/beta hydrolase [Bradyrhizobium sp. 147]|uniref:alpha/beta fold hydrolase n=1 Tax=unclassified Bradyrhizobium TaxID=2631580 RepID=UPI001FFAF340|nr:MULTISPECIES: alpha/beta hydrolase [unclassified Bradyrhizobium]MCK1546532.1 alpha/beta hydrolase [Bradyrhizobium sp. 179]MCK1624263.1 alpha/beta hydrolase [Bradyrhizobium sp. 160]MCK1679933.1 alpha/beta hydrolase [Bradyrhizobium sp. 147]
MLSTSELKPRLLKLSDTLSVRFQKTGNGPPLLLIHTIRTQLEYFRSLAPLLATSHTVYAIDLPGHGHSPIDPNANFDEPYFRQAVIRFIDELDLSDVTIVGESIGGALALTVAASLPQRVKRVYAINPYDYETRYGDGIRRGNWLANFIIGSLQIPVLGAVNASVENKLILGKIMGGGFHDPRRLPADLLAEFNEVAQRPGYKRIARKVLAGWRSWSRARDYYRQITTPVTLIYGDSDWSRPNERERTRSLIPASQMVTLKNTGHFSAIENPSELARTIMGT